MDEKFDWYIELLQKGDSVTTDGYTYTDFIRYVKSIGGNTLKQFNERLVSKEKIGDLVTFPTLIEMKLI